MPHFVEVGGSTARTSVADWLFKAQSPVDRTRRISIGEVASSSRPLILQTLLGSCVAVCLRDPVSGVGGMNHILLPGASSEDRGLRFGVHAMELLINEIAKQGGDRRRLVAKAFGGANVIPCFKPPTIGDLNVKFVRNFLSTEGITLQAHRLGGKHAVQVYFRTDTGRTIIHSVDGTKLPAIFAEEENYRRQPAKQDCPDDAMLF